MKSVAIVALMLLAGASGARADYYDVTDHDLVRRHGHPRPEAVHQAAVTFCSTLTGASDRGLDRPDFKRCMLGRGYRTEAEHLVRTSPSGLKLALAGAFEAARARGTLASR